MKVYVVVLHDGQYSGYSCSLVGVGDSMLVAQALALADHKIVLERLAEWQRKQEKNDWLDTLTWEYEDGDTTFSSALAKREGSYPRSYAIEEVEVATSVRA